MTPLKVGDLYVFNGVNLDNNKVTNSKKMVYAGNGQAYLLNQSILTKRPLGNNRKNRKDRLIAINENLKGDWKKIPYGWKLTVYF